MEEDILSHRFIRGHFSDKDKFKQRLELGEGESYVDIWEQIEL